MSRIDVRIGGYHASEAAAIRQVILSQNCPSNERLSVRYLSDVSVTNYFDDVTLLDVRTAQLFWGEAFL